jgi:hypothetical protein
VEMRRMRKNKELFSRMVDFDFDHLKYNHWPLIDGEVGSRSLSIIQAVLKNLVIWSIQGLDRLVVQLSAWWDGKKKEKTID